MLVYGVFLHNSLLVRKFLVLDLVMLCFGILPQRGCGLLLFFNPPLTHVCVVGLHWWWLVCGVFFHNRLLVKKFLVLDLVMLWFGDPSPKMLRLIFVFQFPFNSYVSVGVWLVCCLCEFSCAYGVLDEG